MRRVRAFPEQHDLRLLRSRVRSRASVFSLQSSSSPSSPPRVSRVAPTSRATSALEAHKFFDPSSVARPPPRRSRDVASLEIILFIRRREPSRARVPIASLRASRVASSAPSPSRHALLIAHRACAPSAPPSRSRVRGVAVSRSIAPRRRVDSNRTVRGAGRFRRTRREPRGEVRARGDRPIDARRFDRTASRDARRDASGRDGRARTASGDARGSRANARRRRGREAAASNGSDWIWIFASDRRRRTGAAVIRAIASSDRRALGRAIARFERGHGRGARAGARGRR